MDRTSARLLAPALLLLPAIALAQGGPSAFQFSFSNPGARSLGLAGAFAALADDATAAFANPAGLVQLTRPEVSFEGRSWSYSTPFTEGGRVSGEPTGILLDTVDGLRTSRSEADLSGLSFLSYVYPKGNWSFAAYRHVLAKFEALRETQGFFLDSVEFPRFADFRNVLDIQIVSYSVAGAYRAKEGLSFGVGLSYFEADLLFVNETYAPRVATLPEGPFGRNVFDPSAIVESVSLEFPNGTFAFSAGFLWHVSRRFSLGGFTRPGPSFDVDAAVTDGLGVRSISGGLSFPDVYGLGAAVRSKGGRLTFSFEWDRVEYSTIIETAETTPDIMLDDADEFRFGAEYVFLGIEPVVAFRGGVWLDPDHQIRSEGGDLTRAAFPGGSDEVHLAAGVGLAFQTFQIDLAVDVSDLVDTASLSAILTF